MIAMKDVMCAVSNIQYPIMRVLTLDESMTVTTVFLRLVNPFVTNKTEKMTRITVQMQKMARLTFGEQVQHFDL